jgi:hypothetical protein
MRNLPFAIQLLIYIFFYERTILRLSSAMSGGVLEIIIHEFHCCIRHFVNYVNVHFLIMHQIAPEINDTTLFLSKLNLASEKVCPKKCVRKIAFEKVRSKKSYFSSAYEYVKLPFSLRVPRKVTFQYFLAILFYMFYLE